jgi:glycosyltransferase involved in cell wall biosynthesis
LGKSFLLIDSRLVSPQVVRRDHGGMSALQYPKISYVLPTLNAAALLDNCLESIARQQYPRDRYEILMADAGSTDGTREIARKYGAIILDDRGRNMEEGKRLAVSHATGEYVIFVDADNEITHPDYVPLAVNALAQNPQALGVESYYLPSRKMSSFCAYVTHLLHISDPVCWMMSTSPKLVAREGEVERWTLPRTSSAYPLGANGFVFRKADLDAVKAQEQFQDTHVAVYLMHAGKREWLRIRGRGVHHYYVQTLTGFLQKRRRAMVHFLNVRQEVSVSWMAEKPPIPGWLACLYCVSVLGPAYHTLLGLIRDRDPRWLWHVPASFYSVLGMVWGLQTHRARGRKNERLVAELQPRQTLKQ